MTVNSLHSFIEYLKSIGEIKEISSYVDPILEISEFTDRECKQPNGGKALLFTNNGTEFPVVTNLYGSFKRICSALYCDDIQQKSKEIEFFFKALTSPKDTLSKKISILPTLKDISSFFPKTKSGRGICQQIIEQNPDLSKIPILKTWPYDGNRFITLPMVNTKDPETGIRNLGMYRIQIFGKDKTAIHWHKHKTGARHYQKYKSKNQKMPVAIAIGGDPVYAYCATAPLPEGIDEYLLAGFLRKKRVSLVKCITQPEIEVPSDVDFVIEGYVDTQEDLLWEGPFGDHTGFYSLPDYYPAFHVTCITHKKNAIYPATVVGIPPMEDFYLSLATEKIFQFPIKMAFVPELKQLHMPACGVEHNLVLTKIENSYEGNASKVKNALWGAGQMMFNKILVVSSGNANIEDYKNFALECLNNFNATNDVYIDRGGVSDVLDHSSEKFTCGGKLFIDATIKEKCVNLPIPLKYNNEYFKNKYSEIENANTILINNQLPILIIQIKQKSKGSVKKLATEICQEPDLNIKILLIIDSGIEINDIEIVVWYSVGNVDPSKHCFVQPNQVGGCLCFDATAKTLEDDDFTRQWPEPVVMSQETILKVNKKSIEIYGTEILPSPSEQNQKLIKTNGAVRFINSK
ncbi:MAG: menaquinone biosynthesis decarboxylase [Bacteroidales bacterium]|nr:menaquinone biosynthesis decarboxylase [Bacteroidales bacterium]